MNITGSVGNGGQNRASDTRAVQGLLNNYTARLGVAKLDVDGLCGPLTIDAIWRYQTRILKAAWADGRIDPGGPTLAALNGGAPAGGGGGAQAAVRPAVNIVATRNIVQLTAGLYAPVPVLIDPLDGTAVDALTGFAFSRATTMPVQIGAEFMLVGNDQIVISPKCKVLNGVQLTPALLQHEQFHYDSGLVLARRFVIDLMNLTAPTLNDFLIRYQALEALHFTRRYELLNGRYDIDTQHGLNPHYQGIWLQRMAACLAANNAETIGGFYL